MITNLGKYSEKTHLVIKEINVVHESPI